MNKRNQNTIKKAWNIFTSFNSDNTRGIEGEALTAKSKAEELAKKYSKCEHFSEWASDNVSCSGCVSACIDICKFNTELREAELAKNTVNCGDIDVKFRQNKINEFAQNRVVGKRGDRNWLGHFENTIGSCIDDLIFQGRYTKQQIAVMAGTKMSKVNSHIAHLRRDKNVAVTAERAGIVYFTDAQDM